MNFTINEIEGEPDEVLLWVSQLYETTSTYEGLEETHVSFELLLEASQVNSIYDKALLHLLEKTILRLV